MLNEKRRKSEASGQVQEASALTPALPNGGLRRPLLPPLCWAPPRCTPHTAPSQSCWLTHNHPRTGAQGPACARGPESKLSGRVHRGCMRIKETHTTALHGGPSVSKGHWFQDPLRYQNPRRLKSQVLNSMVSHRTQNTLRHTARLLWTTCDTGYYVKDP